MNISWPLTKLAWIYMFLPVPSVATGNLPRVVPPVTLVMGDWL